MRNGRIDPAQCGGGGQCPGLSDGEIRGDLRSGTLRPFPAAMLYHALSTNGQTMLFKIIALIAAAIPLILFVRSIFFRRTTRLSEGLKEFKKQLDFAVWAFLVLIGGVVAFAAGRLVWTWLTSL